MSPRTPDNFPGTRIEDVIQFDSGTYVPATNGEFAYVSGSGFRFMDEGILKGLNSLTGSGITQNEHEYLNTLAHDVIINSFDDIMYDSVGMVTMSIWVDSSRSQLLQHYNVVRNPNRLVQSVTSSAYLSGTLNTRIIETATYDNRKRITNIFRARVL